MIVKLPDLSDLTYSDVPPGDPSSDYVAVCVSCGHTSPISSVRANDGNCVICGEVVLNETLP